MEEKLKKPEGGVIQKIKAQILRLKKIKNIEVVACIVILAIALLAYAGLKPKTKADESAVSEEKYFSEMENKLATILGEVSGVGKVDVLITYKGTSTIVPAMSSESKSTEKSDDSFGGLYVDRAATAESSPIMSDGSLVALGKNYPQISGVLIVAEGAENIQIKLKIMQAAATALAVDPSIVVVLGRGK